MGDDWVNLTATSTRSAAPVRVHYKDGTVKDFDVSGEINIGNSEDIARVEVATSATTSVDIGLAQHPPTPKQRRG